MSYAPLDSPLYKLLQNGKHIRLPKGQNVQFSNERMLVGVLNTGYIKRYLITQDGSESIQVIYGPGHIFPMTPLFSLIYGMDINFGNETTYYKTMTATEMHVIDAETLSAELDANPLLYKDLLHTAGVRLSSNIQRLDNLSLKVTNRRVVHQLFYFARIFGESSDDGVRIMVPLTHDDLAAVLNVARETVSLSLARLREKGLVETDRFIRIPDMEALRREIR
jgi:CRP-like cAMP-binding protein